MTDSRRFLCLVFSLAAGVRIFLAVSVPPGRAPDERAHYNYIRALAKTGQPPIQPTPSPPTSDYNEYYQPPLYYLIQVPIYALVSEQPDGVQFAVLRLLNVGLSLGVVALCYAIARTVFPTQNDLVLSSTAIVAFLPSFVGNGSSINNDVLACVCVLVGLWQVLRAVRRGYCRHVEPCLAALCIGIGLLVKFSAVILIPLVLLAAWWLDKHTERRSDTRARGMVLGALPVAVGIGLAVPWLVRQWIVYGDPSGSGVFQPIAAPWAWKLQFALRYLSRSFWVAFGRFNEIGHTEQPNVWLLVNLTCALGAVLALQRHWPSMDRPVRRCVIILATGTVIQFALTMTFGIVHLQGQGRYLFPMLPAFILAVAAGVREFMPISLRPLAPLLWTISLYTVLWSYAIQATV